MKSFKEQLIETWKIFQENWVSFFIVFVINSFIAIICFIPLGLSAMKMGLDANFNEEQLFVLVRNPQFLLVFFVSLTLAFAMYLLSITTSFELANGEKKWKKAFKKALSSYGKIYFMVLLGTSLATLGFCLFIIPGILILFFLSFIFPIVVIEKTGIIETMKKSYSVIKANWKVVVSRFALFSLVSIIFFFFTNILHLGSLNSAVSLIFLPIFYTVLYKELRKE